MDAQSYPIASQSVLVQHLRRAILNAQNPERQPRTSTTQAAVSSAATQSAAGFQSQSQDPPYSYKVKIINPVRKSDVVVRQLHNVTGKFDSVTAIRVKLIEELKDNVPDNATFDIGFFDGTTKLLMVSTDDVNSMYQKYKNGGAIMLWCVGRQPASSRDVDRSDRNPRRKRSREIAETSRQDREEDVDDTFEQLLKRHGDNYDIPKLRLWSRMICSGIHDDLDSPPNIPAFSGAKRQRKESISDALSGAAVAFAQTIKTSSTPAPRSPLREFGNSSTPAVLSPGKAVELRMKLLEQLRYVQQLYDDGILNKEEHGKLKQDILSSTEKL